MRVVADSSGGWNIVLSRDASGVTPVVSVDSGAVVEYLLLAFYEDHCREVRF